MPSAIPYILPLCLTGGWLLHILHDGLASLAPMPLMNPGENPAYDHNLMHPYPYPVCMHACVRACMDAGVCVRVLFFVLIRG